MQLPRYTKNSTHIQNDDFESIVNTLDVDTLSKRIYGCVTSEISENAIKQFLAGEVFKIGADYSESEVDNDKLVKLITVTIKEAKKVGFPGKLNIHGAKFDIGLAKTLYELFEDENILCRPTEINDVDIQAFATQRIFPLITFWRWSRNENINESRIRPGMRNYFYTLLMTAWLFDKGKNEADRWEYIDALSADNIVAIIERPGIGYRRGFAHAVVKEMLRRKKLPYKHNPDQLVRGVMKRATFTFSVSVMPDETYYYERIVKYLFDWSEMNYIIENDSKESYEIKSNEESEEYLIHENPEKNYGLNKEKSIISDKQSEIISSDKPEYWFKLAKWVKENDYFDGRTRKFIFQVGGLLKSEIKLTPKQIGFKNSILKQVEVLGFNCVLNSTDETKKTTRGTAFEKDRIKFYLKKLTSNELGYRNGKLSTGQMFYISKQVADFFPPLSTEINNDSVIIEVKVTYRSEPVFLKLIYHNDRFNRENGTRDEYRIYLTRDIAPDDFFFIPNDIILFERKDECQYSLSKFREGDVDYNNLNELINKSRMKGNHALTNKI